MTCYLLAVEQYTAANRFDEGFSVACTFGEKTARKLELRALTGARTIFDSISMLFRMNANQLLIVVSCLGQTYETMRLKTRDVFGGREYRG